MTLNIILFGVVIVTSTGHVAMHFFIFSFVFLLPSSLWTSLPMGRKASLALHSQGCYKSFSLRYHLYNILFPFNQFSMVEELLLDFNLKVSANPSFFFLYSYSHFFLRLYNLYISKPLKIPLFSYSTYYPQTLMSSLFQAALYLIPMKYTIKVKNWRSCSSMWACTTTTTTI